ncbi:MAG: MFS transporter [Candidatus Sumerlaeia bacterium]
MPENHEGLTRPELRRAWKIVTYAGALGMIYFLICGPNALRTKFLYEMGATEYHFGVMASLASLSLGFQIISGFLANALRRRKPFWMVMTISHRLLFFLILLSPQIFGNTEVRLWWIIGVLFLHDVILHLVGPMWLSWMSDLIPREVMNRYWGTRQRFVLIINMIFSIIIAFTFDYFERHDQIVVGFVIMASAGVALGVIDILLFYLVPEPSHERSRGEKTSLLELGRQLSQPFKDREFRPFIIFQAYWVFVASMAFAFFVPYTIGFVNISARDTQLVFMMGPLGMALGSRFSGLLCDTYGQKPVLRFALMGKIIIPLAFTFAPPVPAFWIPLIGFLMLIDGMFNSGLMLATQGIMLKYTPRKNRTMYIATTNFLAMGITGAIAPFLAGTVIDLFKENQWQWNIWHYRFTGFHLVFIVSASLRLGANFLAMRIHEPGGMDLKSFTRNLKRSKPIKVTSSLYQLQEADSEEELARVAEKLGELRSPLAIRELVPLLNHEVRYIRRTAAEALGKIGDSEASKPLTRALFDPDSDIQSPAARALGEIGDYESLKALITGLRQLDSEALMETIDSLTRIGDNAAILPLVCLYQDVQDRALRRHIASALRQLCKTDSIDQVVRLLNPTRNNSATPRP